MAAVLYGAKGGSSASALYTIDPATGDETSVGATGIAITGLAFHPISDVLYATTTNLSPSSTNRKLYTIDPTTGTATLVGALSIGSRTVPDIAFDSAGVLYGWQTSDTQLVTINISTGVATTYGPTGGVAVSGGGISINSGGTVYTAFSGNPQHLFNIDPSTGARTDLGAMSGSIGGENCAALSFDEDDMLWAVLLGTGTALATIDVATRVVTTVGSMLSGMDALAWGPGDAEPEPTPIEGVVFAFEDSALEPSPVWTRIDV